MRFQLPKKLNKNQKIILYLMQQLREEIGGRKKIMKLFFLLEHYNFENNTINPTPVIGNEFGIYYYGVYNDVVMKDIFDLLNRDYFKGTFPLELEPKGQKQDVENDTDIKDIKKRIDRVIEKFGRKYGGYDLEVETLKMVGVALHTKEQYMGWSIAEVLQETKEQ